MFGMGLGFAAVGAVGLRELHAAPPSGKVDRRLRNRLELWHTYARNSQTLIARYHLTRWSSLLREPLAQDGTLAARTGEALVFRDDGFSGSRTRIDATHASYAPLASGGSPRRITRAAQPAADWLSDRLTRVFFAGDSQRLVEGARVNVPKGRSPRLELRPPLDHPAHLELRGLTLSLDPVGGAVVRVEIAEAQGDRIRFDLSDHRQQLSDRELEPLLKPLSP